MALVGLGVLHQPLAGEAPPPGFGTDFLGADEVLELNGLDLVPQAGAGAAEVRDAGLGADARPGEEDDSPRIGQQGGKLLDAVIQTGHPVAPSARRASIAACRQSSASPSYWGSLGW